VTLDGQEVVLAHVDFSERCSVGKYGVDVTGFERVGVKALQKALADCELVVIDEIGKMELFSEAFRKTVLQSVNSSRRVLGTIMFRAHPWADCIKQLPQVALVELTRANRGEVRSRLELWLKSAALISGEA